MDNAVCDYLVSGSELDMTALGTCSAVTLVNSFNGTNTLDGEVLPLGITTVVWTATDICGNTSSCEVTITVMDDQNPQLVCPDEVTISSGTGNNCAAMVNNIGLLSLMDNCSVSATYSFGGATLGSGTGDASGSTFEVGTTTITYTATDGDGNTAACSFDVVVTDANAPTLDCPMDIVTTNQLNNCSRLVNWNAPTVSDDCGANVQLAVDLGNLNPNGSGLALINVGTSTVTYTATDASGNTATCSFNITVQDAENPVITGCPGSIQLVSVLNACGANANWIAPTASDNCPGVSLSVSHIPGSFFGLGTTTVSYLATDVTGNTATCSFTVTVIDQSSPALTCPANIVQSADAGICSAVVSWTVPSNADNCGAATLSSNFNSGDTFGLGTTTVTYTATDNNGNTATCSFTVTVTDNQAPT
ncbi:MAG TPA: HYR domain-containing protein, partial [Chitinophagales bacterium]|nr:HYR domain-containing protein [Chitinophagales bacterium]